MLFAERSQIFRVFCPDASFTPSWSAICVSEKHVPTRVILMSTFEELSMSDTRDKIKEGIDNAASKAKQTTDKAVDKTKEAAQAAGQKVKEAGQYIKNKSK
jgi:hypothetical protein